MNTHIQNILILRYEIRVSPELPELTFTQPASVSSVDYGFDFDAGTLGDELIAPLLAKVTDVPTPDISAEEFDSLYRWFIS